MILASKNTDDLSVDRIQDVLEEAADIARAGKRARRAGDEPAAREKFQTGLSLCLAGLESTDDDGDPADRLALLKQGIELALACGETAQARGLIERAEGTDAETVLSPAWEQFRQMENWPDEWLVAAIGGESPDSMAFDILVKRYCNALFARCQYLTGKDRKSVV